MQPEVVLLLCAASAGLGYRWCYSNLAEVRQQAELFRRAVPGLIDLDLEGNLVRVDRGGAYHVVHGRKIRPLVFGDDLGSSLWPHLHEDRAVWVGVSEKGEAYFTPADGTPFESPPSEVGGDDAQGWVQWYLDGAPLREVGFRDWRPKGSRFQVFGVVWEADSWFPDS